MTGKTITIISYFLGGIPLLTAIAVFKETNKKFYPFLYFILVTVSFMLISGSIWLFFTYQQNKLLFDSMAVAYAFTEIVFIIWIFKNLGIFQNAEKLFKPFLLFCITLGLAECYYNELNRQIKYFEAFIRITGTVFSLIIINRLLKHNHKNLLVNPEFMISASFIIYYFIDFTSSIFILDFVTLSKPLKSRLTIISSVATMISQIFFTYALILIGKKPKSKNIRSKAF